MSVQLWDPDNLFPCICIIVKFITFQCLSLGIVRKTSTAESRNRACTSRRRCGSNSKESLTNKLYIFSKIDSEMKYILNPKVVKNVNILLNNTEVTYIKITMNR